MGGGSKSPRAPEPIDPGQAQGEYLFGKGFGNFQGITDPRLQQRLLEAEARFRPQYSALELADINTMWSGIEGGTKNPEYARLSAELAGLKAGAAIQGGSTNSKERQAALEATAERLFPISKNTKGILLVRQKNQQQKENRADYIKAAGTGGGGSDQERSARIAQIEAQMQGMSKTVDGTMGYKDLLADASRQSGILEREMLGLQRKDDVSALQEFAPQVVEAYRAADPYSTGLADQQTAMATDLYQRAQGLNPEQQRLVDQQALGMSQRAGRVGDESSVAGQILGRENYLSGLRGQAAGMGQQAFNQNRQIAGDLGSTILGRPSSAIGLGQSGLGQSIGLAAQPVGPQLFDPNMGINMAMQQQANEVNYGGAMAQASAAKSAGMMGAIGSVAGAGMTAMAI